MNRTIALACLVVALAGFGWTYERVNKISSRLSLLTEMIILQNDRLQVRTLAIKSQLAQAKDPIVFMGDSITELALLPSAICGHPVVNAGIGSATAASYAHIAKGFDPVFMAVVAIGANDALGLNQTFRTDYRNLLNTIRSQKFVLVGLSPIDERLDETESRTVEEIASEQKHPFVGLRFSEGKNTSDGVHLTPAGYQQWLPPILKAAEAECAR
ncbi:SGNH/GDSL hydrolase family protein [Bradyrhizobium sp. vgs-9]|uniref:SGNH/GDSL hydrolase family protein n=1 Tax=Bradyrhizobium TaxID=374 RepID=UPI0033985602